MSHKIRLGPIAVFLAIVAIVLATMTILTVSTANADMVMARRFAEVTQERYALEAEGERILASFGDQASEGSIDAAALGGEETEDGYVFLVDGEDYTLTVGVTKPDGAGSFDVSRWKLTKKWNADDPYQNVWKGGAE